MKRLGVFILALVLLLISGCGSTKEFIRVEVPVPVPCVTEEIARPEMHFDAGAKESMPLYQKLSLLLAQDYNLKAYTTKLEAVVKACSQK